MNTIRSRPRRNRILPHAASLAAALTLARALAAQPFAQEIAVRLPAGDEIPATAPIAELVLDRDGRLLARRDGRLLVLADDRWLPFAPPPPAAAEHLAADDGVVHAVTSSGLYRLEENAWRRLAEVPAADVPRVRCAVRGETACIADGRGLLTRRGATFARDEEFAVLLANTPAVRDVAIGAAGEIAVAAEAGLFARAGAPPRWRRLFPQDGRRSWAPRDVRAVAFDARSRLWFASPEGCGVRGPEDGAWRIFDGGDGLPYNDFTCIAATAAEAVWFGTRRGAIRFDGTRWAYRQGRRWLPADEVLAIAVLPGGDAWLATAAGAGGIHHRAMTLAEKARFFDEEIEKRHLRTPYGYVGGVSLPAPGDTSRWRQHDSDNDGLWTSMYGAAQCYAYAVTRAAPARSRARRAFEALRFLGEVTQGGEHAAPPGFVARTILPTDGRDPNDGGAERDARMRAERDRAWKILAPRWPSSASGEWYWKADTSSDELDGHYFFHSLYHDLVAESETEKDEVRRGIVSLTDHLIEHEFTLVDHDGRPTRWARFGPQDLNDDPQWWVERGLNSVSMLSYLAVAAHVSGDAKYHDAARRLIEEHGYAQNALVPKIHDGPGTGNQSDDEMAFMSFYNLIRYERDPQLKSLYAYSFWRYWQLEEPERNPLFNYLAAAVCTGQSWSDAFEEYRLDLEGDWQEASLDTLRRYPLDRVDWALSNRHRLDVVPLDRESDDGARGHLRDGRVLPIDERFVNHWNHDPWRLDQGGGGRYLADGASFLLPYYLGQHHGFVKE